MLLISKAPDFLDCTLYSVPVGTCNTVTVAPTRISPLSALTDPVKLPVVFCAKVKTGNNNIATIKCSNFLLDI